MESPARRSAPADFTPEFVAQVIAGDAVAARRFVKELTPVIHAVVARYLLRCRGVSPSAARQEVKDLVQQVFLALFEDDARVLRQWNPARGRTLRSFAGLIA